MPNTSYVEDQGADIIWIKLLFLIKCVSFGDFILPFPQDVVCPGESNSGSTLIPHSLAYEITLLTSDCV